MQEIYPEDGYMTVRQIRSKENKEERTELQICEGRGSEIADDLRESPWQSEFISWYRLVSNRWGSEVREADETDGAARRLLLTPVRQSHICEKA